MSMIDTPRIRSCSNVRDLGGCDSPYGKTLPHRFVRCGATSSLTTMDLYRFRRWGVSHVLDLRSKMESPRQTCRFSNQGWVTWANVPFYERDISAPTMLPSRNVGNYLVSSYLYMLAAPTTIRSILEFCAQTDKNQCVLFHCAAGMDRTGMVAMLLLGLADVPRNQILADYCYSFAPKQVVDQAVLSYCPNQKAPQKNPDDDFSSYLLHTRLEAIAAVYDTVVETHGSVRRFLRSCDVSKTVLNALTAHLVDP